MTMSSKPHCIEKHISIQIVGSETLLYDENRHRAFCLNRSASTIWRLCNGRRTPAQIAAEATIDLEIPVSEDLVLFTLAELRQDALLEEEEVAILPEAISRRNMIARLGAAACVLLPVVASLAAPKAAQAYSGCVDCNASQSQAIKRYRQQQQQQQQSPEKSTPSGADPFQ